MTEFFEKYLEEGIKDHTMFICIAVVFVIGSSIVILFGKEEEIDSMKPALTMETVMKAVAAAYLLYSFIGTPAPFWALIVMGTLAPVYIWRIRRDKRRSKRIAFVERKFGEHPKSANVISFIMQYENLTFPEAVQTLQGKAKKESPGIKARALLFFCAKTGTGASVRVSENPGIKTSDI